MRLLLLFLVVTLLGAGLFAYSRTLPHFNGYDDFRAQYQALEDTSQDSAAYDQLFAKHVTARNAFKKHGLGLISLGIGGIAFSLLGFKGWPTPNRKLLLICGLAAGFISYWGLSYDCVEAWGRGEIPRWENPNPTNGIFIAFQTSVLTAWIVLHMVFVIGSKYSLHTSLFSSKLKHINIWLALMLVITASLTVTSYLRGNYISLLATPFWFYFYGSLLAIRAKGHELKSA